MFMEIRSALVFILLIVIIPQASAGGIYCDQCGIKIKTGNPYVTSGNKIFCDMECYEKSLPKCSVCGEPVKAGFVQDGKHYCSEKCLSETWESCVLCGKKISRGVHFGSSDGVFYCPDCAKKPVCTGCGLPKDCVLLEDGRNMCKKCLASAVTSYRESMEIIRSVRKSMKDEFGLFTQNDIKYKLVDLKELKKHSGHSEMELGLFIHEQWKNTETVTKKKLGITIGEETSVTMSDSFTILILTSLPKDKFIDVAAHELAHDWMDQNFPNIKDRVLIEGWAEYASSLVNSFFGNEYLNEQKKNNEDPVYGKGYRILAEIAGETDTENVIEFLKEKNDEKE